MRDSSDRSLSRATLWAALIGGICAIIAALIGVSVGNRRADERVQGLQQDVQSRDQSLDSMKSELEKRDAQINSLKARMEEQQRLAAVLQQEISALKVVPHPCKREPLPMKGQVPLNLHLSQKSSP